MKLSPLVRTYKELLGNLYFRWSAAGGLLFLVVAVYAQFIATGYATRIASGSVTDIILSNTPVFDVDEIFIYGTLAFMAFVVIFFLLNPKYIPFVSKSVAAFTLIRAAFITFTHINSFPLHSTITSQFFQETIWRGIFTGTGLFFSGHTGMPFLLALIFWDRKRLRYVFLLFSVVFACIVLLGHIHYTIDVASAYFISYAIFHISLSAFKRDREFFSDIIEA